jgi:hypothetical protein
VERRRIEAQAMPKNRQVRQRLLRGRAWGEGRAHQGKLDVSVIKSEKLKVTWRGLYLPVGLLMGKVLVV